MEIKNTLIRNVDPYRTQQLEQQGGARSGKTAGQEQSAAPKGDRVSLSPAAMLHQTAHQEAVNAPDVRQQKVDALKAKVDSGEYQVDSRKVAEKLLESEAFLAKTLDTGRV
ncbi:flagellar biosynthesis anti-sigma factor FlgM [Desulfovibrio sp. OttesenSCG-928-G15]|nr:flagellar biosynthesis anti-sigma factor FlgM [Desulfovibrio sp. OttesenSCG-928-G15]